MSDYDSMFIAIHESNIDAVRGFLDRGFNPNTIMRETFAPVFFAAFKRHTSPFNNPSYIYDTREPALSVEVLRLLLDRGADVNARENPGESQYGFTTTKARTALHVLMPVYDDEDLAKLNLLLERGADPNLKDTEGNTPLHILVSKPYRARVWVGKEDYRNTIRDIAMSTLCKRMDPALIGEINAKYPGKLPAECVAMLNQLVEPPMAALEAHTNRSYSAPPGTYDVPPGFSESVGEYAYGIRTPRPTGTGRRKYRRRTNRKRNTRKRKSTR
jgi:hypothetical protein